jgi:hypothetical protein
MLIIVTRSCRPRLAATGTSHRANGLYQDIALILGGSQMAVTQSGAMPLSDQEARRQLRRAVIASTIGTTIAWYDFFLYSTVTGLVFAKLYFPGRTHSSAHCRLF